MSELPRYADLPVLEGLGVRHAWGVFGDDDELGTLNLLTPERVLGATRLVRDGLVINLTLPMTEPSPPLFNRKPFHHEIFALGRNNQDDYVDGFYLQGSSQWDGLRHVRARQFGFYGGRQEDEAGKDGTKLGIGAWVEHGVAGRGVLLDVAAHREAQGDPLDPFTEYSITPALLEEVGAAEGVEPQPGDILLIRTGWMKAYLASSAAERAAWAEGTAQKAWAGLAADESMAAYLWDRHAAAVAADNPAVETAPGSPAVGSLHRRLIPSLGLALGELWDLEALSAAAHRTGRFECCLVSAPLNIPMAVGSPANAVALM